jgi:Cytochrome P460
MKRFPSLLKLSVATAAAVLGGRAIIAQDAAKYAVQIPDGLSLGEVRGYETWQVVAISHSEPTLNLIVANSTAIDAYRAGIPGNGKPFPDGSKFVKVQWVPKKSTEAPFSVFIPDTLKDVGIMVKDSKKFADGGGWGYGQFDYVAATDTFKPDGTGAKCGVACHTAVVTKDYVFTAFQKR